MTSTVVHLIDDDDGVRHSLAFLLATAGLAVRVYEFGRRVSCRSWHAATGVHRQ